MTVFKAKTLLRAGLVIAGASLLSACASTEAQDARLDALEARINQALQNSAAAKIDATTALKIAVDMQDQELEEKINQALKDSTAAKIDATTALHMLTQGSR